MADGRELVAPLLRDILVILHARDLAGEVLGLPGRGADVPDTVGVLEHLVDLLQRLAGRFGEHEKNVDGHGGAEDAEDDVGLPSDAHEGGRDEVAKGEAGSKVLVT